MKNPTPLPFLRYLLTSVLLVAIFTSHPPHSYASSTASTCSGGSLRGTIDLPLNESADCWVRLESRTPPSTRTPYPPPPSFVTFPTTRGTFSFFKIPVGEYSLIIHHPLYSFPSYTVEVYEKSIYSNTQGKNTYFSSSSLPSSHKLKGQDEEDILGVTLPSTYSVGGSSSCRVAVYEYDSLKRKLETAVFHPPLVVLAHARLSFFQRRQSLIKSLLESRTFLIIAVVGGLLFVFIKLSTYLEAEEKALAQERAEQEGAIENDGEGGVKSAFFEGLVG